MTFGCPPVSSKPIPTVGTGLFQSIINYNDPVPLAQEAYIKTLIDVYTLDEKTLEGRYAPSAKNIVPQPVLRVSGVCILLRPVDPDAEDDDQDFEASRVPAEEIEQSLFGNPFVHLMGQYVKRVQFLASKSEAAS